MVFVVFVVPCQRIFCYVFLFSSFFHGNVFLFMGLFSFFPCQRILSYGFFENIFSQLFDASWQDVLLHF